ncbi:MAG: Bacterial Ig domain [Thermoplasmatales archaeon]|nr:Bacterial Ig domain [Thermoplasmatales archaeon]
MRYKWLLALTIIIVVAIVITNYLGFFTSDFSLNNGKPLVAITYPADGATVSKLVMISGTADSSDADNAIQSVQIKIDGNNWVTTTGTKSWSYDWTTYSLSNGQYNISARSYNGKDYSEIISISIHLPRQ